MAKRMKSAAGTRSNQTNDLIRDRETRSERVRVIVQKMSKKDLVDLVCKLANDDSAVADDLLIAADGALVKEDLATAVRDAITAATYVPKHLINRNFPYDSAAYDRIEKGLKKLMSLGRTDEAMQLAVELMRSGSSQIELSDEGMMLDEVAGCIRIVHAGLTEAGVDDATREKWRAQMAKADCVGFVLDEVEK